MTTEHNGEGVLFMTPLPPPGQYVIAVITPDGQCAYRHVRAGLIDNPTLPTDVVEISAGVLELALSMREPEPEEAA